MNWFTQNLPTIIAVVIIAAVVGLVIFSMVRNRKKGKSSCGCGCSSCALSDQCHGNKE